MDNYDVKQRLFDLAEILEWLDKEGIVVIYERDREDEIHVRVPGNKYLLTEPVEYVVRPGQVLGELER